MNLLLRQIWALTRKNLLIVCLRRPISTFISALLIPLAVVLIVSYSKEFFASPQKWGVSSPHTIRSFTEGLEASQGRDIVGFVDNGMKDGDVSSVIDSISQTVIKAGKTPKLYDDTVTLARDCVSGTTGVSGCYGAVVFYSSTEQGTNVSVKGIWNYTLRGESQTYGGFVDVTSDTNGLEVYLLPLQRAVDNEIIARSKSENTTSLPATISSVLYTNEVQAKLDDSRTSNFLVLCIYAFGAIFTFCLIGIVYHMTAYVSSERELGMSDLIDTMIPGGSNVRGRLARQIATYVSFAIIYSPSWIVVGVVISVLCFPETSMGVPVGFTILAGFALASFSLFGASFFRKSQLSGSIMIIIAVVFTILPQTLYTQTRVTCYILSLICPAATYTYFITAVASFEAGNEKISMWSTPFDAQPWHVSIGIHWIFLGLQIVVYPILAFYIEALRFSTASANRTFTTPARSQDPTVTLASFSKTYKAGFFTRLFKRRKDVHAVVGISLDARPGQILCLLGPNGSGKSTTMNCIAGQHKVTSGHISVDPSGGLGYAPQANVIWPDLTVEEHIRIFSDLKCTVADNGEVVSELLTACDLKHKLSFRAKTLSGGQKRKLQLAMMFAGGSAVCCVDEVSTGLDPISRRRIWEILLAERHRRTIIMTTHFLDEADYLADNIAIMYKGALRAEGTSAGLKNQFGRGYTIKLASNNDLDFPISGTIEKEGSRHTTVYRVATAELVAEVIKHLESKGIYDYQISGPTMEELFLKVTGDTMETAEQTLRKSKGKKGQKPDENVLSTIINSDQYDASTSGDKDADHELLDGKPISLLKQWYILLGKRFRILKRRYVPYIVAVGFAVVGAGVAPLLIKSFKKPMSCPALADLIRDDGSVRIDLSQYYSPSYLFGPATALNDRWLAQMTDIYSHNHTRLPKYYGYANATELKDQLVLVDTLDEMVQKVKDNQIGSNDGNSNYIGPISGGIWLGDDQPAFIFKAQQADTAATMFNFFNNVVSGVPISAGYSPFGTQQMPQIWDARALLFMIYFGLILASYPAFFALYPTNERISNVRSMQYSNGIRPLPLWLSHLSFDSIFIITISVIATALLAASTPAWFGLGYIFLILVVYGISSTLLSYVISMFAKSAVSAWFIIAMGQIVFYFGYFGGLIGLQSTTAYSDLEGQLNTLFFGMGWISPVVCLERALTIGLGQLAALCHDRSAGSIYLFGGPILYLILQGLFLFILLLWWDGAFRLPYLCVRKSIRDLEATEMYSSDLMGELKRLTEDKTELRVESVTKTFGKNVAVDSVTFGVQSSEIFALLGPNGAGKSTIISMIRGDIKPSTPISQISIAGASILASPVVARSNLGVCPQFDSADVLTVTETLRFFAQTRGITHIDHNVSTVISACGLEPWADQLAQNLSGGTKRKLSLAVALVGNPRVLVLDEPSSALDANAKRTLWKCLQSISKRRAVVLTTHSMEEADALADRIGIVSSRMLAVGDRESLKRRAGENFHIHLVSQSAPRTTPAELQVMKDWVESTFGAEANVSRETQGGQLRFEVPVEGRNMAGLIKMLEWVKGDLGVEYYSVGKATLDEVFENIVRRYGEYVEK